MHINLTPRFMIYTITTTLVFMLLFFAGTAPDVMKDSGTNWEKPAWIEAERAYAAGEVTGGGHHGEGHGDEHVRTAAGTARATATPAATTRALGLSTSARALGGHGGTARDAHVPGS